MTPNFYTFSFLILAWLSMFIPGASGHRVCVKAFVGDRMFNKQVTFKELPRAGEYITVENYTKRINSVEWTKHGTALLFLDREKESESESDLVSAGFEELKITTTK